MNGPQSIDELHERASSPSDQVIESLRDIDSNVLIVGAGGKMGFHLSRMISRALNQLNSHFRVIAISRFGTAGSTRLFTENGIESMPADLTNAETIEQLPDSNNIFYLAGVKFGTQNNPELLRQSNVEMPARIAARYPGARIVALSTGCVYPFVSVESGGSIESDDLCPPGEYAVSCVQRERAFADSDALTSLIRLNYSVDLRYGVLVDLAQKIIREQPIDVSTGFANVIWQGDANRYIVLARQQASNPPFVVNVTGKQTLQIRKVAQRLGSLLNKPVTIVGTEQPTAWLNNASRSHSMWGPPAIHEDQLIEWVAQWTLADGPTLNKPTQFQVRDGNY